MKAKVKAMGVAVAMAVGALSTSAVAVSPYGNATQKGSLLVFPKINVNEGVDTFIQITNDTSAGVTLKCYYQTTDRADYRVKHKTDFSVDLTKNQTIWWTAAVGFGGTPGTGNIITVPQFSPMSDGYATNAGELKCWASTKNLDGELHWNHLVGTATVLEGAEAFTYQAYAFQAVEGGYAAGATGTVLSNPGILSLDGVKYDFCSKQAIGNVFSVTGPWGGAEGRQARVDLVQCDQDLRETYVPPITKYVYEFWNENENKFTGTEVCGDSWIEQDLWNLQEARYGNLKTVGAYFRVSAVGQVCKDAKNGGVMGVLEQRSPFNGDLIGNTLSGRGNYSGVIKYDLGNPNEVKGK